MSDVISVRLRWRLLKASHRVYNAADTFPSADDVRSGRFGSQSEHDKTQLGVVIEHLQNYLELNIPGPESLDIGKLSSDVADWESFATSLGVLLGDLEDLVHKDIFDEKRSQLTMGPESLSTLSGFPKLVALWEALKYREMPPVGDTLSNDNTNIISSPTIPEKTNSAKSAMSPRYSDKSVKDLSQHIRFPRDPKLIEKLHMSTSNFQCALTRISEGSTADWELETLANDITAEDIDVIQHAHVFSSTCTSLFTKMANNPNCKVPHIAKLHLSGFKKDRLVMNIETCQETDSISAVFTRSASDQGETLECQVPQAGLSAPQSLPRAAPSVALNNAVEVTEILTANGPDIALIEQGREISLCDTAEQGLETAVKLLVDSGARLEARDSRYGLTPLSLAAEIGYVGVVKILCMNGADLSAVSREDRHTPLSWAAINGHEDTIRVLIDAGSDMEARTAFFNKAPLLWAVFKHRVESVRLLLQRGAQVNAKDTQFGTALCYSAGEGHLDVVKLLLEYGADTELTSSREEAPLSLAAQRGRVDVVRLLLAYGANIHAKNWNGKTALDLVQGEYNKRIMFDEVVEVLKSH